MTNKAMEAYLYWKNFSFCVFSVPKNKRRRKADRRHDGRDRRGDYYEEASPTTSAAATSSHPIRDARYTDMAPKWVVLKLILRAFTNWVFQELGRSTTEISERSRCTPDRRSSFRFRVRATSSLQLLRSLPCRTSRNRLNTHRQKSPKTEEDERFKWIIKREASKQAVFCKHREGVNVRIDIFF